MAVLQRVRAEKLWYDPKLAKAIGIAEATKYAIFKNLALSKRVSIEQKLINTGKVKSEKELENLGFDDIFKIHYKNGNPFVWGKIFTESDYEHYFSRFDENIHNTLLDWARRIIETVPEEILKNENKFFNQVWKKHRDEEI